MKARAAPFGFPYRNHRSMAQVMRDEKSAERFAIMLKNRQESLPVPVSFAMENADRKGAANADPALTCNANEEREAMALPIPQDGVFQPDSREGDAR